MKNLQLILIFGLDLLKRENLLLFYQSKTGTNFFDLRVSIHQEGRYQICLLFHSFRENWVK